MFYQKDNKKDISGGVIPFSPERGVRDEIASYSQKIATAIYMVTGLMDTEDPLKNRLRARALDMMSFISSFSNRNDTKTSVSAEDVVMLVREVVSLIEVGSQAGGISPMNGDILIRELTSLNTAFGAYTNMSDIQSSSLQTLFSEGLTVKIPEGSYKGHYIQDAYKGHKKTLQPARNKNVLERNKKTGNGPATADRKEKILSVVKEKGNVMIKDISKHIPNCSEKTIQRDLIDLVAQGRLEKRGERRWTTYFISTSAK